MPEIFPVFPVFNVDQSVVDDVREAAGLPDNGNLDRPDKEVALVHPFYGEMLIGLRGDSGGRRRYPVMLLTTDRALYDRARRMLTEWI